MTVDLTWLGHATWLIENEGTRILLDPFLSDSPVAKVKPADLEADYVLVSHGHFDHVLDAAEIANRCNATVVANFEIATWISKNHQVQKTIAMNLGGGVQLPFGHLQMTPAWHSSMLPDGSYGGAAAGFLLNFTQPKLLIYFACDTALFSDMKLIGRHGLDLAVVPIGDLFTMGPAESLEAIEFLSPKNVLPTHYDTWGLIKQDAAQWAEEVRQKTNAIPIVPQIGEKVSFR